MKEGKVVIINDVVKAIGGFVFNFAEPRVEELLPDGSLQEELSLSIFPPLRKSLVVLNDQDGANADQMKAVWVYEWLHTSLRPILKKRADALVAKAKNEDLRAVLFAVTGIANEIVGFFTDDIDADSKQISEYLGDYVRTEAFRDLVIENTIVAFLEYLKADRAIISLIKTVFIELWNAYVGNRDFSLTAEELGVK